MGNVAFSTSFCYYMVLNVTSIKSNKPSFPTIPYIQHLVSVLPISIAVVSLYSAYLCVSVCVCEYVFCGCVITFRASRRPREMYCGHALLSVCLSVCLSAAACPHYCTDPDVTWGSGRGCPLVVHYWADLQSVHGLRCYGNITRTLVNAGCARVAD